MRLSGSGLRELRTITARSNPTSCAWRSCCRDLAELAEDAVQSVFADAQCRWGEIDNHRAYLRRAVSNRVKDGQRRAFRRRTLPPDPEVVTGVPPIDETWAVVCSLPPRQREVVVLRFYEDLSLFEIAATLGRKEATIRSDLRRALIRLRRTIRE